MSPRRLASPTFASISLLPSRAVMEATGSSVTTLLSGASELTRDAVSCTRSWISRVMGWRRCARAVDGSTGRIDASSRGSGYMRAMSVRHGAGVSSSRLIRPLRSASV